MDDGMVEWWCERRYTRNKLHDSRIIHKKRSQYNTGIWAVQHFQQNSTIYYYTQTLIGHALRIPEKPTVYCTLKAYFDRFTFLFSFSNIVWWCYCYCLFLSISDSFTHTPNTYTRTPYTHKHIHPHPNALNYECVCFHLFALTGHSVL